MAYIYHGYHGNYVYFLRYSMNKAHKFVIFIEMMADI